MNGHHAFDFHPEDYDGTEYLDEVTDEEQPAVESGFDIGDLAAYYDEAFRLMGGWPG